MDSVRRDSPGTGEAHREGRAVDLAVPYNQAGFQFVVSAIKSGQFNAIGTNPRWVQTLAPLADQYGVNVFSDPGDGPHAHLQVGP